MISGIVLAQRSWRTVGWGRCAAALGVVVVGDFLVGVAVSALLGTFAGWGKR